MERSDAPRPGDAPASIPAPETNRQPETPASRRRRSTADPGGMRVAFHRSLQLKLFIPVALGIVLLIALQVQLMVTQNREQYLERTRTRLDDVSHRIRDEVLDRQASGNHTRATLPGVFERAVTYSDARQEGFTAVLLDRNGTPITPADSTWVPRDTTSVLTGTEGRLLTEPRGIGMLQPLPNLTSCRRCHASEGEVLGWVWLTASLKDLALVERSIRRTGTLTVIVLSLMFGLTVWALMFVHVRRPLALLGKAMERVMSGDLSTRYEVESEDELGLLGRRFNRMVEQLEATERELQTANLQLMMRAERMVNVGEMASRLAHEIRNPLAGIESVVSIFREDLPVDDPERGILDETIEQIRRIQRTLDDMLAFARPRPLQREEVDLTEMLRGLVTFCRNSKIAEAHHIECVAEPGIPPIHADRTLLSQMFLNVMMNGLQVMQEPGTLRIHLKRESTPEGPVVCVDIADTGPGIPEDVLPKVFKAFFTTRTKGTGLGLAISQSVANQHGGSLEVAATGPQGTTFRFRVPVTSAVTGSAVTGSHSSDVGES